MTNIANKMELYKAVKHQIQEHGADCGFTLVELWKVVNDEKAAQHDFWLSTVVTDYLEEVVGTITTGNKYYGV